MVVASCSSSCEIRPKRRSVSVFKRREHGSDDDEFLREISSFLSSFFLASGSQLRSEDQNVLTELASSISCWNPGSPKRKGTEGGRDEVLSSSVSKSPPPRLQLSP